MFWYRSSQQDYGSLVQETVNHPCLSSYDDTYDTYDTCHFSCLNIISGTAENCQMKHFLDHLYVDFLKYVLGLCTDFKHV